MTAVIHASVQDQKQLEVLKKNLKINQLQLHIITLDTINANMLKYEIIYIFAFLFWLFLIIKDTSQLVMDILHFRRIGGIQKVLSRFQFTCLSMHGHFFFIIPMAYPCIKF